MIEGDWDYVVGGAGTAGCVLANRLSANPSSRIRPLEAGGGNRNPWFRAPNGYFKTIGDPRFDWCLQTDREPHLNRRRLDWPRGRGLGGSSAINGPVHVRGHRVTTIFHPVGSVSMGAAGPSNERCRVK